MNESESQEFDTLLSAIEVAGRGPYPITERTTIGDSRILFVEDIASGWLGGQGYPVPDDIRLAALRALREADNANK